MDRVYQYLMAIVSSTDKGFTLLEILLTIIIISAISLLGLTKYKPYDKKIYSYMSDYLIRQAEALSKREEVLFDSGIYFNSMGHVNQGRSIRIDGNKMIIHLGNGYVTYE